MTIIDLLLILAAIGVAVMLLAIVKASGDVPLDDDDDWFDH